MKTTTVSSSTEGINQVKQWLYDQVDSNTVLFLSGGSSPKELYKTLAGEKRIHPGAVALIDERFGVLFHETSNELMISNTGLLSYFRQYKIPWYPILQRNLSRLETANAYAQKLAWLFQTYPKRIAIVSIGKDGHTAGIAPNREDFTNPIFKEHTLVGTYEDAKGPFGERISLTFVALSYMTAFLLWVMGSEKKDAMQKLFEEKSEEEIPARFYLENTILDRVTLVTDLLYK